MFMETKSITFILVLFAFVSSHLGFYSVNCGGNVNNDELYNLLGVSKTASTKQIRIAFKKLALDKHPDKNKGDPNANANFVKINRAYEILKDEELRKKYDQFGEDGLKENQNQGWNQYQSWNFYQQMGIYDENPEVLTLTRSDFKQIVESKSDTIYFINFYSTQCSHCHELAPAWRELAKQLDGVVNIGAVNCMDDWMLCNEQQIQSFPSLIMFPQKIRFEAEKTLDNLLKFVMPFTKGKVQNLNDFNTLLTKQSKNKRLPWLINFCFRSSNDDSDDHDELNYELNCLDDSIQHKLSIMLNRIVNVGTLSCTSKNDNNKLCSILKPKKSTPIVFYYDLQSTDDLQTKDLNELHSLTHKSENILTSDYKQIAKLVLSYLPDIPQLNEESFKTILDNLKDINNKIEKPWLIQFVYGHQSNGEDNDLKKLPSLLKYDYNVARVDCSQLQHLSCAKYQLNKYPTFVLFKAASLIKNGIHKGVHMKDNWYEIQYAPKHSSQDLAAFVKDNAFSQSRTLTSFDLSTVDEELSKNNKIAFMVDFFAPWCPPCMNLLPEFRKASQLDRNSNIAFGTIDCTVNTNLCLEHNVHGYPTTILFNDSIPHQFSGQHTTEDLSDFIEDILHPSVVVLNYESFHKLVGKKPIGKVWLIDFYASWCGPCLMMAPEWRKLAKRINPKIVTVGQVDCNIEQRLCQEQNVNSYPNIRVYPSHSKGFYSYDTYNHMMRDANSMLIWANNYLPSYTHMLTMSNFHNLVLKYFKNRQSPWLVDFYAPWCGHCQVFAPTFELVASKLEGRVKCGKVNCQEQQQLCQMIGINAFPTILFYPANALNDLGWNSGEDIRQYDVNSLINAVEEKIKKHGTKTQNIHTDL